MHLAVFSPSLFIYLFILLQLQGRPSFKRKRENRLVVGKVQSFSASLPYPVPLVSDDLYVMWTINHSWCLPQPYIYILHTLPVKAPRSSILMWMLSFSTCLVKVLAMVAFLLSNGIYLRWELSHSSYKILNSQLRSLASTMLHVMACLPWTNESGNEHKFIPCQGVASWISLFIVACCYKRPSFNQIYNGRFFI